MTEWQSWEQREQQPAVPPQFHRNYQQPPQYQPSQQLQQYQQPHPYQQQQQMAPYGYRPSPPQVAPKSTGTGLLLGLLIPGAGCMYAGRTGIGVTILVLWLLSIPLAFIFFIGVFTGFILWVLSAVLGYVMTRDWNTAHGIRS